MAHEHQRDDRDKYIVVKPEKISDFEEVSTNLYKQTQPSLTRQSATSAPTKRIPKPPEKTYATT
jgi:hypothetical protein